MSNATNLQFHRTADENRILEFVARSPEGSIPDHLPSKKKKIAPTTLTPPLSILYIEDLDTRIFSTPPASNVAVSPLIGGNAGDGVSSTVNDQFQYYLCQQVLLCCTQSNPRYSPLDRRRTHLQKKK
jgi:hypothetical protein